nr:MAG TPA: hypothetical protein [Caudoviricetes sp.]
MDRRSRYGTSLAENFRKNLQILLIGEICYDRTISFL